ncbi:MAG: hypothetical protein K2X38_04585 [Gemmataceae bacterium]|nr:hypothetical protein [Gemmataceae bacterium]
MARRKKTDDDDDDRLDDEDVAEEEEVADDVGRDDDDAPRPKTPKLTIVLAFLNVAAALAFAYLLMMDYQVRQTWSYVGLLHDLKVQGLPSDDDAKGDGLSAGVLTQTRPRLSSEMLKEAFKARGGNLSGDFQAIEQAMRTPIRIEQLSEDVLKDHFGDAGEPVATLEAAVEKFKETFPKAVFDAAQDYATAKKTEAEKRDALGKILLPLSTNIMQIRSTAKKVADAPAANLDAMLTEAVRRKLYRDFLAPLELFRPGELAGFTVNKTGDLDNLPLANLEDRVKLRLDAAKSDKHFGKAYFGEAYEGKERWSIDKRQQIAFVFVDAANVRKPDGSLLYPKGMDRAQAVSGLADFVIACQEFSKTFPKLEKQAIEAIHVDREGYDITYKGNPDRTQGFAGLQDIEIQRIRNLTIQSKQDEERLKILESQLDQAKKTYIDRAEYLEDAVKKLLSAREKSGKQAEELREFQKQLFQAQLELSEAAEKNFALEAQLRAAEGLKGATSP